MGSFAHPLSVTSADFVRSFGRWQDSIAARPVVVTHHGRDRLVALSMESYLALVERGDMETDEQPADDIVLERITQAYLGFDRLLRLRRANPAACAYLRARADELKGRQLAEGFPDFAGSLAAAKLGRAIEAGEVATFDAPSRAYPGQWLRFEIFPEGDGAACLFRNVTAERQAIADAEVEAALRIALAAHGGIGHAVISPRGLFRKVDPALAALAGFAPESLVQVRMTDIMPLGRRVIAGEQLESVLNGAGPRAFDSAILVNKGEEMPARIALSAMAGEGAIMVVTPA